MNLEIRKPVGCTKLIVREYPSCISLALIEVQPNMRGLGIGSRILNTLKQVSRKKRKPIVLQSSADTEKDQTKLNRFYQRNGFKLDANAPIPFTFKWETELWT